MTVAALYVEAWARFGLARPLSSGWHAAGLAGGWCCRVEQGHYGHRARKPTWLLAVRCSLPSLLWQERLRTPPAFAEILLTMARSVPQ